jgi:UDP-N-acetylglucosamine--N-acetylmuramyl-(pentapeptide) pyrophosphoryl-undecaprenol N-acetylglucosamine transferase
MDRRPLRLVFAGGGTGGHLYPALAIADEIRRRHPDAVIAFVGTKGKIESRIVPAQGYPFFTIWISGFRREISAALALFPLRVIVSLLQSVLLLLKHRPHVVIGTGGYVCGPVVAAAQMLGRRTLIQEQNSIPGVTTRMLAPRADEVHVAFEASVKFLRRRDNIRVSGNPTRKLLGVVSRDEGARFFGLNPAKRTLLIFGGSRGASSINAAVLPVAGALVAEGIQIVWQTGEEEFETILRGAGEPLEGMRLYPFIERMECAYAACDLAVCRSGASTLAELTETGTPSILIPYPYAAADHQSTNALAMVEAGAAMLVPDAEAVACLDAAIRGLLGDGGRLQRMGDAARRLGRPGASGVLADAVERLARIQ